MARPNRLVVRVQNSAEKNMHSGFEEAAGLLLPIIHQEVRDNSIEPSDRVVMRTT
jgi:hypothetical protein